MTAPASGPVAQSQRPRRREDAKKAAKSFLNGFFACTSRLRAFAVSSGRGHALPPAEHLPLAFGRACHTLAAMIGAQLYTLREFTKTPADIAKTLARVK